MGGLGGLYIRILLWGSDRSMYLGEMMRILAIDMDQYLRGRGKWRGMEMLGVRILCRIFVQVTKEIRNLKYISRMIIQLIFLLLFEFLPFDISRYTCIE